MNNKGQVFFYGMMLGLVIIVLALALAPSVRDFTESAMNDTVGDTLGLNCTSTDSNFIKATCVVVDISIFYVIGTLLLIGGAVIAGKLLFT